MFTKRNGRLRRLAEEMRKLGSGSDETFQKPKRVSNAAFFSRIREMRAKGGAGDTPNLKAI